VDNLPDNELIMTDKKNISCWFVNHTDMTIDEYERKNKDLEKERFIINYKKDKK
jgi:hypothetical protein